MNKTARSNTMVLSSNVRDLGLLGRGHSHTCSSCTLHGDTEGRVVTGERAQGRGGAGALRRRREGEREGGEDKETAWPLFSPSRKKLGGCLKQ